VEKEQRLLFRIGFLHAQVSGIFGALKHIMRGTEERGDSRASLAYVKSEIGDLIVQTHLLCDQLDLDYGECEKLGWQRYEELKEIWDTKGYGDKWA
jgi:NTP pyrophosphatase (non-canonical NTP hydrolase)